MPSALHHFAEAEERYRAAGAQVGSLLVDRSELLLSVRLVREAREAAEQAVAEFVRAGRRIALPEGLLLAASAALLDGDHERALAAARQAERAFRRQCRTEWLAFARFVILRCRLASGSGARVSIVALTRVADALDGVGWTTGAADARVQAARLALDRGQPGVASALLHQAGSPRSRGPAELRIRAWHAEALLRVATGRRQAAAEAIRAGLRVVEEYRDTLGSTDLRAHVSAHGGELAELGVRLALTHGSTHDVLEWTERARSTQLLLGRVRPPADEVLATRLAELRAATDAVRAAVLSGEPVAALRRRQSALETAVRDEHRRQHGESTTRIEPPTVASLSTRLGDTVLIEYIDVDGRLEVIIVDSHGARRRSLASTEEVARVVTHLPLALHRAARGGLGLASALTLLDGLGARLDRLLIEPIRAELGERPLTVVPTGVLQSLPWALLPSLAGRPVTVCPSATLWHRASARPVTAAPVLAVAGPGLPKAREEVAAIGEIWPGARTLVDGAATVAEVLAGLGTAGLVHIAAHGRFRIDNPLFSSLQFADGLITVYDLQLLPRVPDVVILAACEAGQSRVCAGDELLGLAAAFLTMGTSTLIASTVAVPDAEVATLMVALHRRLAAGESPAAALASAQRELISTAGPATALVAATSFVCLGASTPVITATPAARRAQ